MQLYHLSARKSPCLHSPQSYVRCPCCPDGWSCTGAAGSLAHDRPPPWACDGDAPGQRPPLLLLNRAICTCRDLPLGLGRLPHNHTPYPFPTPLSPWLCAAPVRMPNPPHHHSAPTARPVRATVRVPTLPVPAGAWVRPQDRARGSPDLPDAAHVLNPQPQPPVPDFSVPLQAQRYPGQRQW